MATLNEEHVRHVAKLARLNLSKEEVTILSKELTSILEYIEILNELSTDAISPTEQITGLNTVLREDVIQESEATTEELLQCSPLPVVNNQIETLSAHE